MVLTAVKRKMNCFLMSCSVSIKNYSFVQKSTNGYNKVIYGIVNKEIIDVVNNDSNARRYQRIYSENKMYSNGS